MEEKTNTFGYGSNHQVNDVNYITLSNPELVKVGFTDAPNVGGGRGEMITGCWRRVDNATGYNVIIREPGGSERKIEVGADMGGSTAQFSGSFSGISTLRNYVSAVSALGDTSALNKRYYDSDFSVSGVQN